MIVKATEGALRAQATTLMGMCWGRAVMCEGEWGYSWCFSTPQKILWLQQRLSPVFPHPNLVTTTPEVYMSIFQATGPFLDTRGPQNQISQLKPCLSKYRPWTSSIVIFFENAESQAPPQANRIRIYMLTRSPGDLCAFLKFEKCRSNDKFLRKGWQGWELESWDHFPSCLCITHELLKNVKVEPRRNGNLVIRTNGSQNGKWRSSLPLPKGTVPGPSPDAHWHPRRSLFRENLLLNVSQWTRSRSCQTQKFLVLMTIVIKIIRVD